MVGVVERRLLVNYRADPETTARLVPAPLRPQQVNGWAVAGICLIRLGRLRPRHVPAVLGLRSENAAHRIAVEWDTPGGLATGGCPSQQVAREWFLSGSVPNDCPEHAGGSVFQRLGDAHEPAGNGPAPLERMLASLHDQGKELPIANRKQHHIDRDRWMLELCGVVPLEEGNLLVGLAHRGARDGTVCPSIVADDGAHICMKHICAQAISQGAAEEYNFLRRYVNLCLGFGNETAARGRSGTPPTTSAFRSHDPEHRSAVKHRACGRQ